jgi:hypothetical protein
MGSAFALFRPMVEAGYRGLFAAFIATPPQVEQIKNGKEPYPRFNDLAKLLDDTFKTDGLFIQFAHDAWSALNGYAHGGLEQLTKRIDSDGNIGAHFEAEEILHLLRSSTSLLIRISIPFLQAMQPEAASRVSAKYLELYPIPEVAQDN